MIRKPNGSDAKRLGTGVLVAGMAAAGAVALASPASAAGVLNSLSISPTTGTADTTHCSKYVVTAKNTDGTNYTGNVTIQLSGDNDGDGNTTAFTCTDTDTPGTAQTPGSPRNRTNQVAVTDGTATFYVGSDQVGTVSIEADNGANTSTSPVGTVSSNTATLNVLQNANNGVSTLSVSPTSENVTAGNPASFVITAKDANGNPVEGVTISRNDANTTASDTTANGGAATTDSNGKATYTVPGSATSNGSTQTFYVNQTNNAGSTGGPDSGEPQTQATITTVPAKSFDDITVSCVNQASNPATGTNACIVPADGTATINAKVTSGTGTSAQPVSGVVVHFTTSGGNLSAATATTDSNGVATVTLTPTTSGTAESDTVNASATQPAATAGTPGNTVTANPAATVNFQRRAASVLVITPGNNTVGFGATITENAQVDDQFGSLYTNTPDSVTFTVTGRNTTNGTSNTNATGKTSFTYTDTASATNPATTDTIAVTNSDNLPTTDNPNGSARTSNGTGPRDSYTITYVSGGVTVSSVGLNFVSSASRGNNPPCSTDTSDPKDQTTTTSSTPTRPVTEVCAIVKNSAGQTLSGQTVTFTVSKGKVGDASVASDDDGMTYTATSNTNGVAVAYVTSSTNGAQSINASAGSPAVTSNTLTDTYSSMNPIYTVTVSPVTANIKAGNTQKFTATATDQSGNGVSGQTLTVTQQGAGVLNNTTVVTASDGTASVNLTTQSTDSGNGSVTFTAAPYDATDNPQGCDSMTQGATCNATATYMVTATGGTGQTSAVANVTAYVAKGARVGSTTDFVSSVATDSDGNPVSGATLQFVISGSTTNMGAATTDTEGRAKFGFVPEHAGSLTVKVTAASDTTVSATATGSTAKGVATTQLTQVSPQKYRIRDTANISVHRAGIQVDFYQKLASGRNKYVGSDDTDANGQAVYVHYRIKSGYVYKGIAKVAGSNDDYNGPNSATVSTKVK